MEILSKIRSKEKITKLRCYDVLILTLIFWGYFIYSSTTYLIDDIKSFGVSTEVLEEMSEEVEFTENLKIQLIFLVIALLYLFIRNFDFKQIKFKINLSALLWFPVIAFLTLFIGDILYSIFDDFNYFDSEVLAYIDWTFKEFCTKFLNLAPIVVIYSLFNGFYEEFFFLGLLTLVDEKYKWRTLLYSIIVRISFHTYQGMTSALIIGLFLGLFYFYLYSYRVKNLLPIVLSHAVADMIGLSIIYALVVWE